MGAPVCCRHPRKALAESLFPAVFGASATPDPVAVSVSSMPLRQWSESNTSFGISIHPLGEMVTVAANMNTPLLQWLFDRIGSAGTLPVWFLPARRVGTRLVKKRPRSRWLLYFCAKNSSGLIPACFNIALNVPSGISPE